MATSTKPISTTATTSEANLLASRSGRKRVVENFSIVWIDANVHAISKDTQHTLQHLRSVVNHVELFDERQGFMDYLSEVKTEKIFVITSGSFGQMLVPQIHDNTVIDTIFIFCRDRAYHEQWAQRFSKIRSVHTKIKPICKELQVAVKQADQDMTAISFVPPNEGGSKTSELDRLESSFMYTQIFKDILLDMEHHDDEERQTLVKFCRKEYDDNTEEIRVIEDFARTYQSDKAVWWYTRQCFTYKMLNRALRQLEGDIIVDMGFFIADLHRQIDSLHKKQVNQYHGHSFLLYRGQGLSNAEFDKFLKNQGGLLAFNNFLSTSKGREVSLEFSKPATKKSGMIGILFVMKIDPKINSIPFAEIADSSYFPNEAEVLFSMHSVFRIGQIHQVEKYDRLFEVQLTLTGDDDPELRHLTAQIEQEVAGGTGWDRIGQLMIQLGQLNKAEELYQMLLDRTSDERVKGLYDNCLGLIKTRQGKFAEALEYYQTGIDIYQKCLPPDHSDFATSYHNIGMLYSRMGEYAKALPNYEKALRIFQKTLPTNHPDLATSHSCIGAVYSKMREYAKALSNYDKALDIRQKTLPPNHSDLATSYINIGLVYSEMGEYAKALANCDKAITIYKKTLPPNHPELAISYTCIGAVYYYKGEYSKALSSFEQAYEIQKPVLPSNHPDFVSVRKWIGETKKML